MEDEIASLFRRMGFRDEPKEVGDADEPVRNLAVSCAGHEEPPDLWPVCGSDRTASVSSLGAQTRKATDDGVSPLPEVKTVAERHRPRNAVVVGHTDCAVVKDAYEMYLRDTELPKGVALRAEPLISLVREAVESENLGEEPNDDFAVHRLVEHNVVRQTAALSEELGDDVTVAGYVYDTEGAYSDGSERHHLVAVDDSTDAESIGSVVPEGANVEHSFLL
jgi:hypothetical protein